MGATEVDTVDVFGFDVTDPPDGVVGTVPGSPATVPDGRGAGVEVLVDDIPTDFAGVAEAAVDVDVDFDADVDVDAVGLLVALVLELVPVPELDTDGTGAIAFAFAAVEVLGAFLLSSCFDEFCFGVGTNGFLALSTVTRSFPVFVF